MLREFQLLEGIRDARRAAVYLCQITGADFKRRLGVFTTSSHLRGRLSLGCWPRLELQQNKLVYKGPLPIACSCGRKHSPMIGVTDSDIFLTSTSSWFGTKFWNLCVFDDTLGAKHISLRDGVNTDLAPLKLVGIDPLPSPSLASTIGSRRSLCDAWESSSLTSAMLSDVPGVTDVGSFLAASGSRLFSLSSSPRSCLCSLWTVSPVLGSASALCTSPRSSMAPTAGPSCTLSSRVRSRSPSRIKRPLVHLRPRGHGSSLVAGASHGSLSARCVGLTVSLCLITFSPLSFNN